MVLWLKFKELWRTTQHSFYSCHIRQIGQVQDRFRLHKVYHEGMELQSVTIDVEYLH